MLSSVQQQSLDGPFLCSSFRRLTYLAHKQLPQQPAAGSLCAQAAGPAVAGERRGDRMARLTPSITVVARGAALLLCWAALLLPCWVAAKSSVAIWEQERTPQLLAQLRREWFPPPRHSPPSIPHCGTKRNFDTTPRKKSVGRFFLSSEVDKAAADRYESVRILGHGAQGLVILASDKLKGGELVAIKKAGLKGSATELKLLQALQGSDDIEKVKDVLMPRHPEKSSSIYVAYERMVMPMDKVHKMWGNSHSEVPKAAMQRILFSLVRGVHYMHTNGVVHLDIKPENVMIAADCSPRIVDLGIAKRLYDSKGKEIVYGGNSLKHGSHPPEYLRRTVHGLSRLKLGAKMAKASDLWSLGMVLLATLHGGSPTAQFRKASNLQGFHPYSEILGAMFGRPSDRALRKHYPESLREAYKKQPKTPKMPLWKIFPDVDHSALSMVKRLLNLDPEARASARDILMDPYFRSVRESSWHNPALAEDLKPDKRIQQLLDSKKSPKGGNAALVYELSLAYSAEAEAAVRANITERAIADAL